MKIEVFAGDNFSLFSATTSLNKGIVAKRISKYSTRCFSGSYFLIFYIYHIYPDFFFLMVVREFSIFTENVNKFSTLSLCKRRTEYICNFDNKYFCQEIKFISELYRRFSWSLCISLQSITEIPEPVKCNY